MYAWNFSDLYKISIICSVNDQAIGIGFQNCIIFENTEQTTKAEWEVDAKFKSCSDQLSLHGIMLSST